MKEGKSSYFLEENGDIKARQFLFGLPSIVLLSSQGLDTQHSHRGSQSTDSEAGNPSLAPGGVGVFFAAFPGLLHAAAIEGASASRIKGA